MENFFPHQRYTSKGEPELGIGIVTETSKGKVKVFFPISNVMRQYAAKSAPLERVIFKPGDTITDSKNQSMIVEQIELADGLYLYYGTNRKISEAELGDFLVSHSVVDKLLMGSIDSPKAFALRRETLEYDYNRRISPVYGFVGGRINLIPHQLYIAHEVSSRYAPRVLLSDQVGLGKTIEACLILHRLLLSERISRVIILVPESLVHQWFVEVLRRFNMWFHIFDEKRCASLEKSAPEGNPFLDNQLILCSIEFLAGSKKRTKQALSANWDMLVVDEAHHLEWTEEKVSPEYRVVEQLSKVANGLLLLTATPEQLGEESHFARLRLLDPERYSDYNDFINEPSLHKDIAHVADKLHEGKDLNSKEQQLLESFFPKERIQLTTKGDKTAREALIDDLLDQHGPGRVLFRNTRTAMKGFPKRKAHLIPLKVKETELWIQRLTNEFEHEIVQSSTDKNQLFWFDEDPRVNWLLTTLRKINPAKILLICKSKKKVLELEKVISRRTNQKVCVFHEDLTIVQRDRNAAWFSELDGSQILLCSEIGSEGRNFQFAHHLVLFDLPLHPELLEQRIGRLDRIGQTKDIHIHIPFLENTPQQVLTKWYHEGLNAFEENFEGGNEISKLFSNKVLKVCKTNIEVEQLIEETSSLKKELQQNLSEGRDRLLEMNSFRPKIAHQVAEQIHKEDTDKNLEMYLTKVFNHFDIDMNRIAPRTYFLRPASITTDVFPSIPEEGIRVTLDRERALSREDFSFLTGDHPMVTGAVDMVLGSGTGSTSFGILRGTGKAGLLLEVIFIVETSKKQGTYVDRFLPNTPLRIVVDHTCNEVSDIFPVDIFNKKLLPGQIDRFLDNEMFVETILPNMISAATKIAERRGRIAIEKGLQQMNLTLNHEIERLQVLHKRNKNIRTEEIQIAQNEQAALISLIKNARVRIEAIQLISKE